MSKETPEAEFFYNSSYTTSELLNADKNSISLNTEALFMLMAEYSLFRNNQLLVSQTILNHKIKEFENLIFKYKEDWDENGMGSGISYSKLISELENVINPPKIKNCRICKSEFTPIDKSNYHCVECNSKPLIAEE